ncbi:MAG: CpsD/CapB family tyrosine-protein kinase [Oscillospiraceae bacterium]|nr:CpsD/CapB family tyrosine-protein kinase [Oscillospiraceae bacterium]
MNEKQDASFGNFGIGSLMNFLDVTRLLRLLLRRLWVIALAGLIVGGCAYVYSKTTYVEEYMVSTTLAFTKKIYITSTDEDGNVISVKEVTQFYTSNDATRYQRLLTSDAMTETVALKLGGEYSPNTIKNSMRVSSTDVAGFFNITVRSTNYDFCANAIVVIINEYPEFLRRFDSTLGIDVINKPGRPAVTNASSALTTGMYGAVAGAAFVAALLLLVDMFARTIRSADDVRNKTTAKFLGAIPLIEIPQGGFKKKKKPKNGVLITDESSVTFNFVESFKSIRTKLEGMGAEKGYKVFAVTSTFEDEGKTTVSTNIACALAQKGKSVLLIDCDLRKPAIMNALGVKEDKQGGVIPIVKGTATYVDSIKFVKSLGIFVMPTGGVTTKSTEILDMDAIKDVFKQARSEFDYIVVDTPPTHVVTDSLVLADMIDSLIFAVKSDYAKVNDVNETLEEIYNAGIEVAGVVLTMAEETDSSKYYKKKGYRYRRYGRYGYGGYGSSYGASYGYGYGGGGYGYGNGYGYGSSYAYGKKRYKDVDREDGEIMRQIENRADEESGNRN